MKKEMLINVLQPEECRIAIVEDGILEELYVERTSHESYTGNIYKGKIVNIEPAIQAAFVDFSVGRNGFLHVSDVEPHYYRRLLAPESELGARDRGRDPRRDRDRAEPRPPRPEDRPPRAEDRPRDRDRDRPDRSEKGRRDRSERRFGEGLLSDWEEPAPPPPRPVETPPPPMTEPRRGWVEPPSARAEEPPPPRPAREPRGFEAEEPRGRTAPPRPVEPIEAELPPSRTQRGRGPAPAFPRGTEAEEPPRGRISPPRPIEPADEPEPESFGAVEPRRGRGRGRAARPLEPEIIEPEIIEPEPGEFGSEPPRRRGGRAAIRSRGGDREPGPERPRPIDRAAEFEPEALPPADLPEPPPDRPRTRGRAAAERPRTPEAEPPRERRRPHARAGEPGYVPRRERARPPEPESELPPPFGWSEAETERDEEPIDRGLDIEAATELLGGDVSSRLEGPRRRRRRRGRRRGEPAERLPGAAGAADEDDDRDYDESEPTAEDDVTLIDDLDFDETDVEDEDDVVASTLREARVGVAPEEEIDPELEEEIRREIEEIAELEREMGLRGRRGEEPEPAPRGRGLPRGRGVAKPPIQDVFRRGDEVLVQVIKESIGTKGPTLSTYISIPGRYLVLMPGLNRVGVSRKIADESQRRKLREIMNELNPPKGLGFIVRTAGLDRTKRELARDLAYLLRLWKVILRRIKKARAPAPIYQESDMITRTIRDIFNSEIDTIWIDEPAAFERAQEFLRVVMPKFVNRLKLYEDKVPLFHKYGLEEEIAKIQRRRVDLPQGGSIVIDQTEALVAIDVNSGNFRVEDDAERTAYEMNLRAAKEIARQLRLRDLGGVIVNDFIDLRDERHRRGVERALREAIQRDRARTKVLRMSQFGIIEMTRQRIRPSLKRSVYEDCPHCQGAGVVKSAESMSIDVMRMLALASHREEIRRVNVCVAAPVATYLNNRKRGQIARIETEANMVIHVRHEEDLPAEHLQFDCFDAANNEVRLLPAPPPPPRRGR